MMKLNSLGDDFPCSCILLASVIFLNLKNFFLSTSSTEKQVLVEKLKIL